MDRLKSKRAVITGSTTGIGFATAQRFLQEGAWVAITGQNADRVETARRALGSEALAIRSDSGSVSDTEAIQHGLVSAYAPPLWPPWIGGEV